MNRSSARAVFAVLALRATTTAASWQSLPGPYEGPITGFVARGSTLYAASAGSGAFASSDGGVTWSAITQTGLTDQSLRALAFTSNGDLWAGANGDYPHGGVWRLPNGGASWTKLSSGMTGGTPVMALLVHPITGDVFAGADDSSGKAGGTALFRWPSGGSSWSAVASIPAGTQTRTLEMDALGNLFAGTLNRGVYRSTDSGLTWVQSNTGLTSINVLSLTVDPTTQNAFAGTLAGVFRSTDHGATWGTNVLSTSQVSGIGVDSTGRVFAGTYDPKTYRGSLQRSTDGGTTFAPVAAGLSSVAGVQTIDAEAFGLFVGANGAFRSTDGGLTFSSANAGLLAKSYVNALTVDPAGRIYAGSDFSGVFRSTDGGASWTRLVNGLTSFDVRGMASTASAVFVGTGTNPGRLFRSTDQGASWQAASWTAQDFVRAITVAPNGNICAAASFTGDVWTSTDGGATWAKASPSPLPNAGALLSFGTSPATGKIFVGTEIGGTGLFVSSDNGLTWTHPANAGLANGNNYGVGFNAMDDVFASEGIDMFRSTDQGASFTSVNGGIDSNARYFSYVLANDAMRTLYAASTNGVYRSTDGGTSWTLDTTGYGSITETRVLGTDPSGFLYAGVGTVSTSLRTWIGGGLYRSASPIQPATCAPDAALPAVTAPAPVAIMQTTCS